MTEEELFIRNEAFTEKANRWLSGFLAFNRSPVITSAKVGYDYATGAGIHALVVPIRLFYPFSPNGLRQVIREAETKEYMRTACRRLMLRIKRFYSLNPLSDPVLIGEFSWTEHTGQPPEYVRPVGHGNCALEILGDGDTRIAWLKNKMRTVVPPAGEAIV